MALLVIIPLILLLTIIATALLQWLWNIIIPLAIAGGKEIGFWVAFRLLLIGGLLSGAAFLNFNINLGQITA